MTWWFEDAVVGAVIAHPRGRTITLDEHARLAWLTDNASPVHGDVHRSSTGPFGQVVVLGALSVAIVLGLAEPGVSPPGDAARAASTGWRQIALTAIVLGGDTLTASSLVTAARVDPDGHGGLVTRTIEGRNQAAIVVTRIVEERWVARRP